MMNGKKLSPTQIPHLTPASLVGRRFGPDIFKGITVALVGFCPRPPRLDAYNPRDTIDMYFIHVPPTNVQICEYKGLPFLSIAHVYGGPVSSALIEELAYYGIETVLAYGLAGGLGTKEQKMGDFYLVEKALALDGTTPHYTDDKLIPSNQYLNAKIMDFARKTSLPKITPVQAVTTDAIYREFDEDLAYAKEQGCDIINCDSAHLFAVSREVDLMCTQCGVISDVATRDGEEWESTLAVMLSEKGKEAADPLDSVGKLVAFYVENLVPELLSG
jgi:uridine phosphorylase